VARLATLTGMIAEMAERKLSGPNRLPYPLHLWLSPVGAPGAQQWGSSIIVGSAQTERAPLEWARQIAHEWGHAVLPGVTGFREPEAWANGDLGERLFLPWLQEAGWLAAWDKSADGSLYARRYVTPLRDAFAKAGPNPKLLTDPSRKGYDQYLGMSLYVASTHGAVVLSKALSRMEGDRPTDFVDALQGVLTAAPWVVRRISPVRGSQPVYIPRAGRYILTGESVRRRGKPVGKTEVFATGWTMLEWAGTLSIQHTGRV
jgi:hypothetical protein